MDFSRFSEALTRRRPLTPIRHPIIADDDGGGCDTQLPPLHPPSDEQSSSGGVEGESPTTSCSSRQKQQEQQLKRTLQLPDVIFYGVGCSVGAGIYSLVGIGAQLAGPAIAMSFAICGIACCFTSLCYAEFAARVPLAGSAYTFAYVSFGEMAGWLCGWNLTLGYAVSAAVVARSWAEYLVEFVQGTIFFVRNTSPDTTATKSSSSWLTHAPIPSLFGEDYTCCPLSMLIVLLCTAILISGAKESTRFNNLMTILNLSVLGFVLLAGIMTTTGVDMLDNLTPVFPRGAAGMARGAGLVFFAYLGFDMVACLSEEVIHPERNMPIGIIGSLAVSMSIYVAVSLVVVGMAPLDLLGEEVPIVNALLANACCTHSEQLEDIAADERHCLSYSTCLPILRPLLFYGSRLVSFGAIFGLTTATFACLMGQPRIFYSMAQDGLIFPIYKRVNPKTGVPTHGTVITGVLTALVACFVDLQSLADTISLGTLQVFTFVNAGVILLRTTPSASEDSSLSETMPVSFDHNEESSPLVNDVQYAALARSLGLVKSTSIRIKSSIRGSSRAATSGVHSNGSKPLWLTIFFTLCAVCTSMALPQGWTSMTIVFLGVAGMIASSIWLCSLPQAPPPDTFACPWVPYIPLLGIASNSYMMGSMPLSTWLVILVWLLSGVTFYFAYSIHNSELRQLPQQQKKSRSPEGASSDSELVQVSTALLSNKDNSNYASLSH